MTSVLLTGASGFAGSHILETILQRTDWDVVCLDSLSHNGMSDRITAVTDDSWIRGLDVRIIRHDLTARLSPIQRKRIGNPDYIINMASLCQVDQSIREPAEFISNNVELMLTMLELAREVRPSRFIQFSTDEVYGTRVPMSPSDHAPSSPYAASKAAQEDICHAYARTFDLPITIMNSANMFGERQSLLAFIPKVIRAVMHGEKIQLHVPGVRHYTYVGNVANHIVDILPDSHLPSRIGLKGQQPMDTVKLAELIASLMGKPLFSEIVRGESVRPGYDHEYAEVPGADWNPSVPFEEGLARTIDWAQANSDWF